MARGEKKIGATTRFVELLATVGSFLLVLVTLPFSLCFTFKVVQEYERAVVFRMGRLKGAAYGPGKPYRVHCDGNKWKEARIPLVNSKGNAYFFVSTVAFVTYT